MNITVYLGANEGNDPSLRKAVQELGTWIGESGNSLVYGGSKSGLMGQIAESVLNAGGKVTGVEPQFFIDSELQYDEITKLIVTKDMAERKAKMIELGDAFIAFPGGTGHGQIHDRQRPDPQGTRAGRCKKVQTVHDREGKTGRKGKPAGCQDTRPVLL